MSEPAVWRAEGIYVHRLRVCDVGDGLVDVVGSLASSAVHIALKVSAEASTLAHRFAGCGPGSIVVADQDAAVVAADDGSLAYGWDRGEGATFEEWWFGDLWRRGVGPKLVAVAAMGVAPTLPARVANRAQYVSLDGDGDTEGLMEFLRAQAQIRIAGALPAVDRSPGWFLAIETASHGESAVNASLLASGSGTVGVRGELEDRVGTEGRFILAAGAYGTASDGMIRALPGPDWSALIAEPDASCRRVLDLHTGLLAREPLDGHLRTVRFASLARPGVLALRAASSRHGVRWEPALAEPSVDLGLAAAHRWVADESGSCVWAETVSDRSTVTAAAGQRTWTGRDDEGLERLVAVRSGDDTQRQEACDLLAEAQAVGFDRLLDEHRQAWARRWAQADIEVDGDPDTQLALRFALFHLLSCASTAGEAAVGARGLTGLAYAGHVFWDTDVFVLPALAAVLPEAARSVLEYRLRRLPVSRQNASDRGLPGARFAWESADIGGDVTPGWTRDLEGRVVPIHTGEHAEHINADVAWAVHHYLEWTGDHGLLDGGGVELVVETARYWLARIRADGNGRGHLYGVVGPDEYHEVVDDNAYTNNLARWHLRWAAELVGGRGDHAEAAQFEAAAASLVDGYDPTFGCHEQFAGFWALEPVIVSEIADPPVAADVLLGRERTRRAQVIKQPDVLMLHHLLPESCPPGSLTTDLAFYLPRIAHGSSLSPAICAALVARDGRPDDAMELLDLAARLDLDDLTATTAGGLHLATMGGLWQAVVYGFAGIRPGPGGLHVDPHLPSRWNELRVRVHFRGEPVHITVGHDLVEVDASHPVPVSIGGRALQAPAQARYGRPERSRR